MIFLLSTLLALSLSERDIPFRFRDALSSPTSDMIFSGLSRSADKEFLTLALLGYIALGDKEAFGDSKAVLFGGLATATIVHSLKFITNRQRPCGPTNRFNSSFPSGHVAASFFLATYFSMKYPSLKIPLYLWAVGVGLSRLYLLKHWPSDIVAGSLIGGTMGLITFRLRPRIVSISLW